MSKTHDREVFKSLPHSAIRGSFRKSAERRLRNNGLQHACAAAGLLSVLLLIGCTTEAPPPAPPAPEGPSFEGPLEFLRSIEPGLRPYGPAGYAGLDPEEADDRPADAAELAAYLERLAGLPEEERQGHTIGLYPGRVYDLTGLRDPGDVGQYQAHINVPSGVTVAAMAGDAPPVLRYRFPDDAEDLLRANAYSTRALLAMAAGSRLLGVHVKGPDVPPHEADYEALPRSRFHGVRAGNDVIVEHCAISGFHWSGVSAQGRNVMVRGCDIYAIHAYPVLTGGSSSAEFTGNRIRWSWHAVAGGGMQGSGYVFRHNLVIHEGPGGNAHAVDMHAWRQMMSAGGAAEPHISIAGDALEITGNVFVNDEELIARWRRQPHRLRAARQRFFEQRRPADHRDAIEVCIRGVPRDLAVVSGNWFANEDVDRAVVLTANVGEPGRSSRANLWVYDNYYGPHGRPHGLADVSRARIRFIDPPLTVERHPETRRWDHHRVAVLQPGESWQPVVDIEMPPGVRARSTTFRLQDREQVFDTLPDPGSVVFDTEGIEPGVQVFTVLIEDERGVLSRHDMTLTLEAP